MFYIYPSMLSNKVLPNAYINIYAHLWISVVAIHYKQFFFTFLTKGAGDICLGKNVVTLKAFIQRKC